MARQKAIRCLIRKDIRRFLKEGPHLSSEPTVETEFRDYTEIGVDIRKPFSKAVEEWEKALDCPDPAEEEERQDNLCNAIRDGNSRKIHLYLDPTTDSGNAEDLLDKAVTADQQSSVMALTQALQYTTRQLVEARRTALNKDHQGIANFLGFLVNPDKSVREDPAP